MLWYFPTFPIYVLLLLMKGPWEETIASVNPILTEADALSRPAGRLR
jgi:hypothetical protein